jgi:hypothetical protein
MCPEGSALAHMIPRKNMAFGLVLIVLAIAWALWQHTYSALALLIPLIAFPFFLRRARRRSGR